jgi:hypothetical protein
MAFGGIRLEVPAVILEAENVSSDSKVWERFFSTFWTILNFENLEFKA